MLPRNRFCHDTLDYCTVRTAVHESRSYDPDNSVKCSKIGQSSVLEHELKSFTPVTPNMVGHCFCFFLNFFFFFNRLFVSMIATRHTCSLQMRYRLYNPMHSLLVRLFAVDGDLRVKKKTIKKNEKNKNKKIAHNELIQI